CVGYNESDRYRYGEYSKRYDNNYGQRPQGYGRDYRDRDKLENRTDKRSRYSQATNYPYNNYENNIHMQHYHYRDSSRYAPEWPHDKRTGDYRRSNYDRRPSN
uniref:Uncharacterized protein n=1 Tax=Megaselia scalaris TaxID=36166 RepID=T1H480_MEGSC